MQHELHYVRVVDIHLKHSMGWATPGAQAVGLWAYDLDKALFSFECIFKMVDLVIDKCISQVQLIYGLLDGNVPIHMTPMEVYALVEGFVAAGCLLSHCCSPCAPRGRLVKAVEEFLVIDDEELHQLDNPRGRPFEHLWRAGDQRLDLFLG